MKPDDIILCPLYSITSLPKPIEGNLFCELIEREGRYFLKYRVTKEDIHHSYEKMFLKFRFICIGLSVATIGHFWVQDVLLNEQLEPLWTRRKSLQLIVNKEIEPAGPRPLSALHYALGEDLMAWISINYPRVFTYYTTGLFLLRSSLPVEYLYADVLLNYFKIIELVTYKRTKKKPELDVIIADSKAIGITCVDEEDIRKFYIVRSRDSAHDHDKVKGINRRQAVECKMWVDELITRDMITRAKKPRNVRVEVTETPHGAIFKPIQGKGA
jgi:hypothetical protein